MTLVMRYLFVSRVERETNNDLKSSSLRGSDRSSGLYNSVKLVPGWMYALTKSLFLGCPSLSDISCGLGMMFAFEDSNSKSAKRFPS